MKGNNRFEDMITKDLDVRASDRTYNRMWQVVLGAHGQSTQKPSAIRLTIVWRTIMKSPIVKLAVAAALIAMVVVGIFEYIGTGSKSKSGVVWAEVAKKVQASRGVIYRHMESRSDPNYSMHYLSGTHSRTDKYEAGKIAVSHYLDFEAMTASSVFHTHKYYWREAPLDKQDAQAHDRMSDPKWLVQSMLSCEHRKLGRKTIEGILCEGLETTDPAVFGSELRVPTSDITVHLQLWVSVETDYPVLCEGNATVQIDGNTQTSQWVIDQFQWDVELDARVFEPNIPPDYEQI